jgi:hypothetical protein
MKRNIPTTHVIHYVQVFNHEHQRVISNNCFNQFIRVKLNCNTSASVRSSARIKFNYKNKQKQKEFYHNVIDVDRREKSTYKNSRHCHKINYCKLTFCGDIEVNPGPTYNIPSQTIHAPYCQGNIEVFGENAGRQCVPMSLCSLIYLYCNGSILESSDLVSIIAQWSAQNMAELTPE